MENKEIIDKLEKKLYFSGNCEDCQRNSEALKEIVEELKGEN